MDIHEELQELRISPSFVVREFYSESAQGRHEHRTYWWVGYREGREVWGQSDHHCTWAPGEDDPGHWNHLVSKVDKLQWLKTCAWHPFPVDR